MDSAPLLINLGILLVQLILPRRGIPRFHGVPRSHGTPKLHGIIPQCHGILQFQHIRLLILVRLYLLALISKKRFTRKWKVKASWNLQHTMPWPSYLTDCCRATFRFPIPASRIRSSLIFTTRRKTSSAESKMNYPTTPSAIAIGPEFVSRNPTSQCKMLPLTTHALSVGYVELGHVKYRDRFY